jgi:DNA end-binding protein Ku
MPVKAYTATATGSQIRLNQLHRECNSPIKYKKTCPLHGEVDNAAIVSGYQYAKGQYVVVDPEEINKLRRESDKAIAIDGFFRSDALDPIHYSGKNYYLTPDGPVGGKPYALLYRAMEEEGLHAVGKVVMSGREQVVVVRPYQRLLVMTMLSYENQIKKPSAFVDELTDAAVSEEELKLTKKLVAATLLEDFDLSRYKDMYTERLTELIEAKVAGREVVAPPAAEEPQVVDLMDALKQSVARARAGGAEEKEERAAQPGQAKKKMAPSARQRRPAKRKKKSG